MDEQGGLTLENLSREVEKIGSLVRSISVQVGGLRTRVADLELGGIHPDTIVVAGKKKGKTGGKSKGKGKKAKSSKTRKMRY
jgi:hypothetical protein